MLYTRRYLFCALLTLSTAVHASHNPLQEQPVFEMLQRFVTQSTTFAQDSLQCLIKQGAALTQKTVAYAKKHPLLLTSSVLLLHIGLSVACKPAAQTSCPSDTLSKEYDKLLKAVDMLYYAQPISRRNNFYDYAYLKMRCLGNMLSAQDTVSSIEEAVSICNEPVVDVPSG